jgi:hypothetical protein
LAVARKFDHPPLLAPGRHVMTIDDVRKLCVEPFPGNQLRSDLYYKLEQMFQDFLMAGLPCEFWIDGSYFTEKPEPEDLDVTVIVPSDYGNQITDVQRILIDKANDGDYASGLSSFVFVELPRDHPDFGGPHDMAAETARTYGNENSEQWLKGFAVVRTM